MLSPVLPLILCGKVEPLGTRGHLSGIGKQTTPGPWQIQRLGLLGDAQADGKNHGGPEKAVHHYPFDHYGAWRKEMGLHPLLRQPGAFGENFSTTTWTEETVHVGDVVRLGSVLLQVSQGRQPCWKLNVRFGRDDVAYRTQSTGRTGWYYRVLEDGEVSPGDRLSLVDRPQPDWPLARLITLLYRDKERSVDLEKMAELPELAQGWRTLAARRLATRKIEDWAPRLQEPGG